MEVENITKQYVVPMSSGVHMEIPQKNQQRKMIHKQPFYNVVDTTSLGQEKVIEEMSGADGTASQNTQIVGMEDRNKALNEQNTKLDKDNDNLYIALANATKLRDEKYSIWNDCTWKGGSCTYYKCKGKCYNKKEKDQFLNDYENYSREITRLNNLISTNKSVIETNKKEIEDLQAKLDAARTSAAKASMTSAELQAFEASQKQADAQAQATVIEAQARAASTKSKSKVVLIIGIAAGVALLAGLTFYLIKGRKKGVPAPVAPVVK